MEETPADEEFGDSEEIDPAAAARAVARIAEFVSASEGILSAGTSEGGTNIWLPRRSVHEGTWAAVKPGIPLPLTAMNGWRPRPGRALIGRAAILSACSGRPPGVAPPDRECKKLSCDFYHLALHDFSLTSLFFAAAETNVARQERGAGLSVH